jgi:hypothetical protein
MTALATHLSAFLREHLPRERMPARTQSRPMPMPSLCWCASPPSGSSDGRVI